MARHVSTQAWCKEHDGGMPTFKSRISASLASNCFLSVASTLSASPSAFFDSSFDSSFCSSFLGSSFFGSSLAASVSELYHLIRGAVARTAASGVWKC